MHSTTAKSIVYVECDVPEGVTLRDWRRARAATTVTVPPRTPLRRRVRRARRGR